MIGHSSWERPVRFRDGLMVGLLIARPVRLRAFIGLTVDWHLARCSEGYLLRFSPSDMKDQKAREFTVPHDLTTAIDRYLSQVRPQLLAARNTDRLWVSRRGDPLSYDGFQAHLRDITEHAFGIGLRPHAFRHIAATSIAEDDPAHVNIIASVLGHATLTMAEKHYNRANGVHAARAYQHLIAEKRRTAHNRARIRRKLGEHDSPSTTDVER